MNVLLKLLYAAAITALIVLLVAFGIRTFYGPPEMPEYPLQPGRAYYPPAPATPGIPQEELTPAQIEYQEAQDRYQDAYEAYAKDLRRYHAIVFALAALAAVAAVAGGVALSSRLDALRLGLVGGGLGTLIYGVIQAEGDIDDLGAAAVFVIVAAGLVLVVGAGYRWLSAQDS
jgi:hypothetical protein